MFPGSKDMRMRHMETKLAHKSTNRGNNTMPSNRRNNNLNDNDGWFYPQSAAYQPYMVDFMEFFHGGVEYDRNQTFTREQLV